MKKKLVAMRLAAMMLAAVMVTPSVAVYADEETADVSAEGEEGGESEEGEDMENPEGEGAEESSEDGALVMSGLAASNGKEIAAKFPDSIVPEGFHKTSVEYSGQSVDVAYMDSDGYGEVVLAYLANSDGSDADFYLCDINTAQMSDYVRIPNGEGKFIVVLDPGDNVVAPSGFIKATLDWHGKKVTAWALPQENSSDEASIKDLIAPVEVYALDITAGASGDDSSDDAEAEESTEEAKPQESKQAEPEDGSRVEYASPSDFFLIYAIDQDGKVGFYLYDIAGETFQRYVAISGGENALLTQYRKDARTRLIIMIVLAVLLLICIIIIINLVLGNNGGGKSRRPRRYDDDDDDEDEDDDDDEDDERKKMIRRVAKKEKTHIRQGRREMNYMMDIDDEDDEEDEDIDEEDDDEEIEEVRPARRRRPAEPERRPVRRREEDRPQRRQPAPARRIIEDTEDEDDVDDIPVRRTSTRPISKTTKSVPKKGISIEPDVEDGLDDDFEFEFLDI